MYDNLTTSASLIAAGKGNSADSISQTCQLFPAVTNVVFDPVSRAGWPRAQFNSPITPIRRSQGYIDKYLHMLQRNRTQKLPKERICAPARCGFGTSVSRRAYSKCPTGRALTRLEVYTVNYYCTANGTGNVNSN